MISEEQVIQAQNKWGSGVVKIGSLKHQRTDCENYTNEFLDELYGFEFGSVLFKPTKCEIEQFRPSKQEALSYFIAGEDRACNEDNGFAIKGWTKISWENTGYKLYSDIAVCMGNYFFSIDNSEPLKVEFTIVLKKIDDKLKLVLHDSHLPFQK